MAHKECTTRAHVCSLCRPGSGTDGDWMIRVRWLLLLLLLLGNWVSEMMGKGRELLSGRQSLSPSLPLKLLLLLCTCQQLGVEDATLRCFGLVKGGLVDKGCARGKGRSFEGLEDERWLDNVSLYFIIIILFDMTREEWYVRLSLI